MPWNWQQPDWPRFRWDAARLTKAEERFLLAAGRVVGSVKHVAEGDRDRLRVEALIDEALTTSEIEGELLDRDSVQSSIRRRLGWGGQTDTPPKPPKSAEEGISEVMVDLFRNPRRPLSHKTLFAWHKMVTRGRTDLRDVGRYRTHKEPMQVVSGRVYEPKVHFEAPPSSRVPREMGRFIAWFNATSPTGKTPLPPLTRAGLAHFYFESIHPFEDGNGRIGRAIAENSLAQALGRPSLIALAATILARQREYYAALEVANKRNEVTDWLAWFAGVTLEAQLRTLANVEFLIDKTKLLERVRADLNPRQSKVLLRVLAEGPEGFTGGLSAGKYVAIAKTSPATASRDLAGLVGLGVLTRTGEKKHTRYHPVIPARPIPRVTVNARGEVVETVRKS